MIMATPKAKAPDMDPPVTTAQVTAFGGAPQELPQVIGAVQAIAISEGQAPALTPPTETELKTAEEIGAAAAWYNGKKITALWCNQTNRNSYISVPGLGWKKLAPTNDSSVVSMTIMAAHAEQTNATVNIRVEDDGMVHQIYVW